MFVSLLRGRGSVNEGRVIEGQRNLKTRLRPTTRGRDGIGSGDKFPFAASAFAAASRGVSYGMGNALCVEHRYPQVMQSASTSPNYLDILRLGAWRWLEILKGAKGRRHVLDNYSSIRHTSLSPNNTIYQPHASSSQYASQHYHFSSCQHHQHQRAQGTCSHLRRSCDRPLSFSEKPTWVSSRLSQRDVASVSPPTAATTFQADVESRAATVP